MSNYTNEGNLERYLTIDIENQFSPQIERWCEVVTQYIDNYCGRKFGDQDTSDKYFDGNGEKTLVLPNFMTINSVQVLKRTSDDADSTLTEGRDNDFIVYPYNESPKFQLHLMPNSRVHRWPKGKGNIKINAQWGNIPVPADVELAATMLLASIVEKGLKGGSVSSESLGDYSVTFKQMDLISSLMGVKDILDRYKIYEF